MLKEVVAPAVILTVAAKEYVPGAGIGGSSEPTLDPPANPTKTDSACSVYVPGGNGISKCPINAGSREPNGSPRLEQVCGVGAAGFTQVTRCPGFPVNRYPETAEAVLRLGALALRAMTFTPWAGVRPSEK